MVLPVFYHFYGSLSCFRSMKIAESAKFSVLAAILSYEQLRHGAKGRGILGAYGQAFLVSLTQNLID